VNRAHLRSALVLTVLVAMTISCQPTGDREATVDDAEPLAAPTPDELYNATYHGFEGLDHPVTLVDGRWEGEPYQPGAASRPALYLVEGLRLTGDVDGDGSDEAVAVLAQDSGGSGEFIYLAVVGHRDGTIQSLGTTLIGDRVQIRGADIDGGRIALDVVRHGPDDPACCPGELATMEWQMTEQGLNAVGDPEGTGQLSLDTIAEIEWTLREWKRDEPAEARPEVVLKYTDGRFIGIGGCNTFFAATQAGTKPGHVSVGPPGRTRKACPEPSMEIEERFLKQLDGVRKFGFVGTRLALTYENDGTYEMMLFDLRGPSTTSP
jgi:heat shock protein HslJ